MVAWRLFTFWVTLICAIPHNDFEKEVLFLNGCISSQFLIGDPTHPARDATLGSKQYNKQSFCGRLVINKYPQSSVNNS